MEYDNQYNLANGVCWERLVRQAVNRCIAQLFAREQYESRGASSVMVKRRSHDPGHRAAPEAKKAFNKFSRFLGVYFHIDHVGRCYDLSDPLVTTSGDVVPKIPR